MADEMNKGSEVNGGYMLIGMVGVVGISFLMSYRGIYL